MRVGRRVADAFRDPRRLGAFVCRIARLALRGELAAFLGRIRARGASAADYRAWSTRKARPEPGALVPFLVAVDLEDEEKALQLSQVLRASATPPLQALVRVAGGWSADGVQARSLSDWIAVHDATWVLWIVAPVQITDEAVVAFALGCEVAGARVVYADHEIVDERGSAIPVFASAWDRVRIAEQPYPAPVLAIHAELAPSMQRVPRGVAGQWQFLVDAVDAIAEEAIVHVPHVVARVDARDGPIADPRCRAAVIPALERLASTEAVSISVDASRIPWLSYMPRSAASVSVVIPTRDRPDLLERCVDSVFRAGWPADAEIVVVDNGSTDPRLGELLRSFTQRAALRTVRMDIPFNFAQLCNAGVDAARGRIAVLLNNDAEVHAGWLGELVPLAMRNDVGAVGPLILYPDGRIQSAGVFVGVNRTATSALEGFDARSPAAQAWCASRRRMSAMLGACFAVERAKYQAIGGMDASFAVSHNEVDFCLRLDASGLANVFTPFARVIHVEGATRGFEVTPQERTRLDREEAQFLARWRHVIDAVDPAHHPALARKGNPFLLASSTTSSLQPRAGWRRGASASSGDRDTLAG